MPRPEQMARACQAFVGTIDQLPPMHSALKKDGKALYEYARAGIDVERATRRVTLHAIDIVDWNPEALELTLAVRCSKGTYIRVLAEDIGAALGCGCAPGGALRRTGSGGLTLDGAATLETARRHGRGRARRPDPATRPSCWPIGPSCACRPPRRAASCPAFAAGWICQTPRPCASMALNTLPFSVAPTSWPAS